MEGGRWRSFADQIEIAQINEDAGGLTDNKDRVSLVDGIAEKNEAAAQTEVPEGERYDTMSLFFTLPPLHQEAQSKEKLTGKTDAQPDLCIHDGWFLER